MAELADAHDSKSCTLCMWVRFPPSAQKIITRAVFLVYPAEIAAQSGEESDGVLFFVFFNPGYANRPKTEYHLKYRTRQFFLITFRHFPQDGY